MHNRMKNWIFADNDILLIWFLIMLNAIQNFASFAFPTVFFCSSHICKCRLNIFHSKQHLYVLIPFLPDLLKFDVSYSSEFFSLVSPIYPFFMSCIANDFVILHFHVYLLLYFLIELNYNKFPSTFPIY